MFSVLSTPCLAVISRSDVRSLRASVIVFTTSVHAGTPTLQQLLKSLKKLDNWFVFGVMLSVPVSQLKKIKSSYNQSDIELCKIDMLQYWLDNKLVPVWKDVILALEETDQLALHGCSDQT